MIVTGYIIITAVVVGLIFLSEKALVGIINEEYCRKILHIGVFSVFPIAVYFWGTGSIHFIIICAVFSLATLFLFYGKKLKNVDKRENSYPGIFYYAFSLFILATLCYFFDSLNPLFGVAFIGLAIGDGFATLIGYTLSGSKIYKNKTYSGFIACFLATLIALLIYSSVYRALFSVIQLVLISVFVSIIELVDFGLDNLLIPIGSFGVSFLILNFQNALIALLIFEAVFLIAFLLKVIEYYGALMAASIGFLFYFFAGAKAFLFIVGCYAVMISVSIIGKILKNDVSAVVKKTGAKDITEIFVNGVWAVLAIVLFAITSNEVLIAVALLSMSEGFVDSLASDVGTLSKKTPYDIIKRKRVQKGVSGGVTFLGSIASFIGAFIFAFAITCICDISLHWLVPMACILYIGCIADTVLGSLVQVKYKCKVCGCITEKENHCSTKTEVFNGISFVNNDVVNCLSGLVVFVLSVLLFVLT